MSASTLTKLYFNRGGNKHRLLMCLLTYKNAHSFRASFINIRTTPVDTYYQYLTIFIVIRAFDTLIGVEVLFISPLRNAHTILGIPEG